MGRPRSLPLLLLLLCCLSWQQPWLLHALPLCTDARAPAPLNGTVGFCSYSGSSCCDAAADAALKKRFEAMSVSDAACAAVVKSILCAKCSPFSAELFNSSSKIRMVPLLCNYTSSGSSAQSKDSTQDYCKLVWETCKNVTILNSPFQPSLQGSGRLPSSASKLIGVWQSENDFCTSFGGSSDDKSVCFSGNAVSFNTTEPPPSPKGVCLERIGNGSYLNMAPHPDGSNRVFLSNQAGKIWLANVPEQGSGGILQFDEATSANPSEVSRIFTMGLPYTAHHAGQILFGPTDGYLYFMMGDGGNKGDPFNFSQNKKSLLGKIMRLDVDNVQSQKQIGNQTLWGNYSIPKDNPFAQDSDLQPEIWALGFRNPWRCSFDSERPSYFYCADVGQDAYEEVDLISKGGNYGWRAYEGPYVYHPEWTPGGNTSLSSINAIFPAMGYSHSTVNKNVGSASITGGYVYRGSTDPCLYGRYIYADLYASAMWTGSETPPSSGNYTSTLTPFSCSKNSPIPCESAGGAGAALPSLGYIFSFGEDNRKDVFVLASKGVYRVVRPSLCGYTCASETPATGNGTSTPPPGPPSSLASVTRVGKSMAVALACVVVYALYF
ncbi:unnamed protein product [Triticum turgidum subsp. durum]|uniref:Glucose/Sorbosone dehydrogenase domain-containing protein n=1 Tax=Triticum turgidum subsp. durum TaxID=4567 RepID=A0A9R0STK6_TRITD|nr:unnamed protein product [Triticum turgidum subsp. durum]